MHMYPVDSSAISSIGYNYATCELRIQFRNNTTYSYSDVPPEIFHALHNAESIGRFFTANIRPNFTSARIA